MTAVSFALVGAGVLLLYLGGEALVRGAVDLARGLGLTPMVIGLTVVAFATSAPELAASLTANLQGVPDVALGNVLGSNVANVGLILGLAALLRPLTPHARFLRREIPTMLVVTVLLYPILLTGEIGRLEGLLLMTALAVYLALLLRTEESPAVEQELAGLVAQRVLPVWAATLWVVLGIALLVAGAKALVAGAVAIAVTLGVPERVIGLTLVAVGTSLPELASSLVAARRDEPDIVLGNVVGSNVFNLLCILGFTALVRPLPVPEVSVRIDFWVVLAFSLVVVPLLFRRAVLGRWQGALLVGCYAIYVATLLV